VRKVSVWLREGVPQAFRSREQTVIVTSILDCWRESGEWWNLTPEIWVWRVQCDNQGIYELACHPLQNQWWIARIYD